MSAPCRYCGGPVNWDDGRARVFCEPRCKKRFWRDKWDEAKSARSKAARAVPLPCKFCGVPVPCTGAAGARPQRCGSCTAASNAGRLRVVQRLSVHRRTREAAARRAAS